MKHIRANLLLLGLTVVVCCVAYPGVLWVVGRAVFPSKATGSLITEKMKGPDGKETEVVTGSRLIGQPFTSDEYFWSRPSAASYNATASGGSNWGANNPKLRDRVAQQLGPLVVYKKGSRSAGTGAEPRTPQQDIEAWFAAVPDRVASWAADTSVAPGNWAKTDFSSDKYGLQGEFILAWVNDHPEVIEEWQKANPTKTDEPKPEDLVGPFFASFAKANPGKWPGVVEVKQADGTTVKRIKPLSSDPAISANFFDLWVSDPANKEKVTDLEPVIADMVMASGSGLDPHITLRNALSVYQLDRVAGKRTPAGGDATKTRKEIEELLKSASFTPLSGLVGEPLVNVLELNVELNAKFPVSSTPANAP